VDLRNLIPVIETILFLSYKQVVSKK